MHNRGTIGPANDNMTNEENGTLRLTNRSTSAVGYARQIHVECRKGTDVPSMAHLLGVASLVMGETGYAEVQVTEDMVIAALLHDAVEDHGGMPRLQDIEQTFGLNVARMVSGLSDTFAEDPGKKESWRERKEAYIERLREEPADVRLISAADKLYNVRATLEDYREVGSKVWDRFQVGRNEQLWYFDELLKVYNSFGRSRIVDELERVTAELARISADATEVQ